MAAEDEASASLWLGVASVALLWGATNPLMRRFTVQDSAPRVSGACARCAALLANGRFLLAFALNQLGSVLYMRVVARERLSVAQPLANALTLAVTAVAARALGESPLTTTAALGVALILAGSYLAAS